MSEFRLYPCNPSLLKQLSRIRAERRRRERTEAIAMGVLSALFGIGLGVLAVAFFWAASE
ncbi:MAG: hypothetical protein K6E40_15305 [Desulfovibrio sp.]|nr:hypothetical protein [Desulfovibrio sp.]